MVPEPTRPFHVTRVVPAEAVRRASTRRTTPFRVSTVATIFARRASENDATSRAFFFRSGRTDGLTRSDESVLLSVNVRSATDAWRDSSVALTPNRHVPSWRPSPDHGNRYTPGARVPASTGIVTFPGPTSVASTLLCLTTLYDRICCSATPSSFG